MSCLFLFIYLFIYLFIFTERDIVMGNIQHVHIQESSSLCHTTILYCLCQHVFEILLNVALVLTFKMHSSVVTSVE